MLFRIIQILVHGFQLLLDSYLSRGLDFMGLVERFNWTDGFRLLAGRRLDLWLGLLLRRVGYFRLYLLADLWLWSKLIISQRRLCYFWFLFLKVLSIIIKFLRLLLRTYVHCCFNRGCFPWPSARQLIALLLFLRNDWFPRFLLDDR